MKIIKPSASLMEHNIPPYEFIERVGRTCYKSEDKITVGSAEKFVESLVKREHMAMLEHEHIYLVLSNDFMRDFMFEMDCANEDLTYFNITRDYRNRVNVFSGSFRSFYDLFIRCKQTYTLEYIKRVVKLAYPLVFDRFPDSHFFKDFKDGCVIYTRTAFINTFRDKPNVLFTHLIHTFKFVCDRGVTHEFVRHRPASFAQESTRYCNYSKEKFGNEITLIKPCFWEEGSNEYIEWKSAMRIAESHYFSLTTLGATPQEARTVLPNSLKTELIVTATESEWQHIVNLRYLGTTGAPHPQIKEVVGLALEDLMNETNNRVKI